MFHDISQMLYGYIMQTEMVFLRLYKVNPFEIMKDITLLDLQHYMKMIEDQEKKEQESIKKKDIMGCLKYVNDALNMIFHQR